MFIRDLQFLVISYKNYQPGISSFNLMFRTLDMIQENLPVRHGTVLKIN